MMTVLRSFPPRRILFVCTGNTCRSPLAAAICRARLAERLACAESDLPSHGFVVESAGVMASRDDEASPGAVEVAREYGARLEQHRSQQVNADLLRQATDVLAMTSGHAELLTLRYSELGIRVELLGGPGSDLPDPIGGDAAAYLACATLIATHLDRHLANWTRP